MDSELYVGIDLGGTSVKCALGKADGTILAEGSIPTDSHAGPEPVISRIGAYVNLLVKQTGMQPTRLGMTAPGLVDIHRGITRYLPNITTHWRDVPVAEMLSKIVNCPVLLLNDVRTATYGELIYGSGRDISTMAFLAIGTGIGGGIVIDGKLRLGPHGAAGELGHQTIDPTGPMCGCGNRGCLETMASGTALAAEGIRLMLMGLAPALYDAVNGDPGEVTAYIMSQVAEEDAPVKDAILQAGTFLGIGISNVIVAIHPELVVVGGGVANMGPLLLDRIREDVACRIGPLFPSEASVRIEPSALEEKAGVMGAIALAVHGFPE